MFLHDRRGTQVWFTCPRTPPLIFVMVFGNVSQKLKGGVQGEPWFPFLAKVI